MLQTDRVLTVQKTEEGTTPSSRSSSASPATTLMASSTPTPVLVYFLNNYKKASTPRASRASSAVSIRALRGSSTNK